MNGPDTRNNPVKSMLGNLAWGCYWGMCGAVFYVLIAIVVYLVQGRLAFQARGITLPAVVKGYLFGGLGAGVVLGLLRPLGRWWWGAAVIGFFCAAPVWLGGLIANHGFTMLTHDEVLMVLTLAALSGPICGVMVKRQWTRGW